MTVNKSKSYLLPLFGKYLHLKFVKQVYNTYLFLEGDERERLIIQYTKDDSLEFLEYIEELKNEELVEDVLDKDEYIFIIANIPEELKESYDNFVLGNFSQISKKEEIVSFLMNNYGSRNFPAINRIKQVLYKDRALKEELEYTLDVLLPEESELSSVPNKELETLNLEDV